MHRAEAAGRDEVAQDVQREVAGAAVGRDGGPRGVGDHERRRPRRAAPGAAPRPQRAPVGQERGEHPDREVRRHGGQDLRQRQRDVLARDGPVPGDAGQQQARVGTSACASRPAPRSRSASQPSAGRTT